MAEITVTQDPTGFEVAGVNFESDVPFGMHVEYKPSDHSQGRTGNFNWVPGPETSAGPGTLYDGVNTDENGELDWHLRRSMFVGSSHVPGELTVTVYQDPELLGQGYAAKATVHVT